MFGDFKKCNRNSDQPDVEHVRVQNIILYYSVDDRVDANNAVCPERI